ncbi:MAG: tetratricopeptide repeat-containing sensor histidine kinase, partial [Sphingobacteriales bacterium]
MEMGQEQEALKWFFAALNTSKSPVYHEKNSNIYSNIAGIYKQKHQYDSAELFIRKSLDYSRKQENVFFLANSLSILASIYIDTDRPRLAEQPLQEALAIREKIGDPFYVVSDMALLAIYYEALGENYKAAGDFKNYSKTLQHIQILKDSVYEANTAAAKAEMDVKYNLTKKENIIIQQQANIDGKNNLILGSVFVLFFTISLAALLFYIYKKNRQIELLKMQAEERKVSANAVLSAQENERKRISRDLHDNLGAYATVLVASAQQLTNFEDHTNIKHASKTVSENARKIMGSLQETIWVLSNDVITITDLIDRFKLYTKDMLR